ncbi:sensor domain-containing diguanylate cyclase [Photobacterium atrarenae]|uniref:diguanylate cyclase n=1 Tax=Photobacterium atrarenae TaxID=865757 RepID=A0ABY5GKK3_9GAMM|nr:sensor domain-containing diguanylate cyclase [Photobacterium atrarenae]UTV29655.1 sensor domain-containing diguanylate cyclase [Photobacterium atrarenae]
MASLLNPKVDLRKLILLLTIASVLITLSNALYSIYKVQRELLIQKTLDANQVYADKMAKTTDTFIEAAQEQLAYSAGILRYVMTEDAELMSEADRLRRQTKTFNSVVIVDAQGMIVAVSPETLEIKGARVSSKNSLRPLQAQRPLVSDPFISSVGNYLISISHPIFSEQGEYLGYVAGAIYLEKRNIIASILGKHSYQDGSYLYVVDRNKTLIHHPDKVRIGEVVTDNVAINTVLSGKDGAQGIENHLGLEMLAGYALVGRTGWGIVAQRSKSDTLSELDEQMTDVFVKTIPIGLVTLLGIWVSSIFISRPLWQLASGVKSMERAETVEHIRQIRSWYFEAAHLKAAITRGFDLMSRKITQLDLDSHTDPMTGLLNRRGMLKALDVFGEKQQPFSVVALDIDFFKQVNDTHGHDVGDEVITVVANLMREQARRDDILCRSGGEEFLVFLADTSPETAYEVAERLRQVVERFDIPVVGKVTISIGIAYWPGRTANINTAMKQADNALYDAKANGRNRTEVCVELVSMVPQMS